MGHILPYNSIMPKLGENVFVAPTATVAGDVTGDGKVDISDVNAVINVMLGK